jgi:hypothetical protein
MTKPKKPPPKNADEWSAFQRLLKGIARVPKAELDEKEAEYQRERAAKKAAG